MKKSGAAVRATPLPCLIPSVVIGRRAKGCSLYPIPSLVRKKGQKEEAESSVRAGRSFPDSAMSGMAAVSV